jgi:cobalt-zinc-cadmium efflux system outer membrane protein
MTGRMPMAAVIMAMTLVPADAQTPEPPTGTALASGYMDPAGGLSLEQAIARAAAQEPSLRAARTGIDSAQAMRSQASLRPNPTVSFEHREEPAGTDNQTTIGVEWPLDLFRRSGRVAVADREIAAVQLGVENRERLLSTEVRTRYGLLVAAVRELATLDDLVDATERQQALLRARVEEGAAPPLERDLLEVELRRLLADRLLQAGRADDALFALRRVLGLPPDATLTVSDTLEAIVQRESARSDDPRTSTAIDRRPDVREAAARVEVSDASIDRAAAEGRFDVSLFGNYMRMDAGFAQRGFAPDGALERVRGTFHYVSAGAILTLPLLNRNQGNVGAAKAERAGAAAAYEAVRLTAQAELAAAHARDERARRAVREYTAGAQSLARRNLEVITQSYELGRVTVFEVLAERRRYLDVERAYTDALRSAYDARTALLEALGGVR